MSKVGSWSTTAGNNNATPPDGWPEGQAPSTVNDCAREMMASIKTLANNLEYVDLNNTPNFLTATTFSMATADVTNFEIGRRLKLFDATTLYGTIISVSTTFVQVQLDSGALTTSLSSVAMGIIKPSNNSLPTTVYRNKNVIINGQMEVWQRGVSFTAMASTTYMADRFVYVQANSASVNAGRLERSAAASNVPTLAQVGVLLNNSLVLSVSAVDATIAAADFAAIQYKVEGYDWRQIAHKPLTLAFWVTTNKSGTYAIAATNTGAGTSFVQNFTMSAVNTWTRFSISIPAAPTTGTWDYSTGIGLILSWTLACGSNFQVGAGNWTAVNGLATSSQVNFLISANNVFAITAVSLREGPDAPFEIKTYTEELEKCQRYYYPELGSFVGVCNGGSAADVVVNLPVSMRIDPTVTLVVGGNFVDGVATYSVSAVSIVTNHVQHPKLNLSVKTATTGGRGAVYVAGRIDFNSEL